MYSEKEHFAEIKRHEFEKKREREKQITAQQAKEKAIQIEQVKLINDR